MKKYNRCVKSAKSRINLMSPVQPNNHLWQARTKRGLRKKQVAYLLGNRTEYQISRFERGVRTPSLKTALKLELIYGAPVRWLFGDITARSAAQVQEQLVSGTLLQNRYSDLRDRIEQATEYCSYSEQTRPEPLAETYRQRIRRHIATLTRIIARF